MKRTSAFPIFCLFAAWSALSALPPLSAESFRVTRAETVDIPLLNPETAELSLGYNDGVAVLLPRDRIFLAGVEIEVKSPETVLQYPGAMAYAVYSGLSGLSETGYDFQGEKLAMEMLPAKLTFVLRIPLQENHGFKSDPYTEVMEMVPAPEDEPLFFRLFPVMKGLPEEFETAAFLVKVRPVLNGDGGFRLQVSHPDGAEQPVLSVRIDEQPVDDPGRMMVLPQGAHHVAVSAEKYRTEVRTFTVEQANVTEMTLNLKETTPTVVFASPDNVTVTLDGEPVENPQESRRIAPGKHTVTFSVGGYELHRQFTAEEGRDYSVSMTVDAEISEVRPQPAGPEQP